MVAAAGALEMTGGQRVELEGLARSHTAPAREVRQAKALLWAAAEGTAAVGRPPASEPSRNQRIVRVASLGARRRKQGPAQEAVVDGAQLRLTLSLALSEGSG